ncbi:MAG: glycosyltransferase family 4 protein [Pirellulales bacterium]|nr:glycosyltransferase family 4 protein [Pirellulales bacterium]
MNRYRQTDFPRRQRILLVAHSFCATSSMESRLSWFRATCAAEHYDTTVVCAEPFGEIRSNVCASVPRLKVVTVPHTAFERLLIKTPGCFYLAYRLWHRRVLHTARALHAQEPFALVHQVSYCGYREPGYCWQLGIPFVWGPVGGTQNVPWRFLGQFNTVGALKEACRSVANRIQLAFGVRVGKALRAASAVFVANQEVQQSFCRARGVELPCQLETGIDCIADEPRSRRDPNLPFHILWAGRLENWKALPLLLRAIAALPDEVTIRLRVLGSGSQQGRWQRMATRLGLSDRIEWIPLPDYGARAEHYRWADVFAFTSLRDTSGTGLLESLAVGVPIIGLNHQGARDIMTDDCAVRIPVEHPQQVISAFQAAIVSLARDPSYLQQMGRGALLRARCYLWSQIGDAMIEQYGEVLKRTEQALFPIHVESEASHTETNLATG